MKIDVIVIKENSGLRIVNDKYFKEEIKKLLPGKYKLTINKLYREKTNSQLSYYYAAVLPLFLNAAIDAGWEFTSIEELDFYLKSQFANKELINKNTGEIISIPALKRNMTTVEFSTFVNNVRDYASEFLGVYIPEPGEQIEMLI